MSDNPSTEESRGNPATGHYERREIELSLAQIPLWVDQSDREDKPIYNVGGIFTIDGELDVDRLTEATEYVLQGHDVFSYLFRIRSDGPRQFTSQETAIETLVRSFVGCESAEQTGFAWLEELFWQPFDLQAGRLARFAIAKVSADRHFWLCANHHLIGDGFTRSMIVREIAEEYNARNSDSNPRKEVIPRLTYEDAIEQDRLYLRSEGYKKDRSYWERRMLGFSESRSSVDAKSDRDTSGRVSRHGFALSPSIDYQLRQISTPAASSRLHLILSIVSALYEKVTGQDTFLIGVVIKNRPTPMSKRIAGHFSKVIPFGVGNLSSRTLTDAAQMVKEQFDDDLKHSYYPIGELISLARRSSSRQLFELSINYHSAPLGLELVNTQSEFTRLSSGFTGPICLAVYDAPPQPLRFEWEYDGAVYSREAIICLGNAFLGAVANALNQPTCTLKDVLSAVPASYLDNSIYSQPALKQPPPQKDAATPILDSRVIQLLTLMSDIVGKVLGPTDNFFHAGGNSIKALEVIHRFQKLSGSKIPLASFFKYPTCMELIDILGNRTKSTSSTSVSLLRGDLGGNSIVMPHALGGETLLYSDLVSQIAVSCPVIGINFQGTKDLNKLSLVAICGSYVRDLISMNKIEQYHLIGWSFGGLLAHEIGRQLEVEGKHLGSLTLIDTPTKTQPTGIAPELQLEEIYLQDPRRFRKDVTQSDETFQMSEVLRQKTSEMKALAEAAKKHQPGVVRQSITLFKASKNPNVTNEYTWSRFTAGGVDVIEVESDHYEMIKGQAAARIGAFISDKMRSC